MNKIGILGGMSYESTLHYYEGINRKVNEEMGGLVTPELFIDSVNFSIFRDYMVRGQWDSIKEELLSRAEILERAGADYLAIATNTMHKAADYIDNNIDIPLIHIGDSVADACIKKDVGHVGLLGTMTTMKEDFMKSRLRTYGISACIPEDAYDLRNIDRIIFDELCKGITSTQSKKEYLKIISKMIKEQGIEGVILGCTEIGMLINQSDLDIPVFDTTECHIDDIVSFSLGKDKIWKY